MLIITRKEYNEIVDVLEKNFCHFCSPFICSESYCDIQDIMALLNKHIEHSDIDKEEYDEELPF